MCGEIVEWGLLVGDELWRGIVEGGLRGGVLYKMIM